MLNCQTLWESFKREELTFFTGVPDSTFKDWLKFLNDNDGAELTHRIAAIERDAIGLAAGYFVATKKIPVVYMQNSGLGNTVNPITSLADPEVYNIPVLLLIGWRGEPGKKDEPQHVKMGKITTQLLYTMGIKYSILPDNPAEATKIIQAAKKYMVETGELYALIIQEGIFEKYSSVKKKEQTFELTRETAIQQIIDAMQGDEIIVSTTGKTSRELFEYRETKKQGHQNDFLMVGSMGLASSFAAEIAIQKTQKKVFIFDGDGALLMSAGTLATIGYYAPENLVHIVFDNASYDSTGGQPTVSTVDFEKLALANNYLRATTATTRQELIEKFSDLSNFKGPQMLIVKVNGGARDNLGRPTITSHENLKNFITNLAN